MAYLHLIERKVIMESVQTNLRILSDTASEPVRVCRGFKSSTCRRERTRALDSMQIGAVSPSAYNTTRKRPTKTASSANSCSSASRMSFEHRYCYWSTAVAGLDAG